MKSSLKKKSKRQSESQFYEPTKAALGHVFGKKRYSLEITADRQLSGDVKQVLTDYNLFANVVERFIPDLTGYIEEDKTESLSVVKIKSLVVVEVKPSPPRLKDIFQTKEYAEIFGAKHAFLISPQPLPEEIKRILVKKSEILSHSKNSGMVLIGHLVESTFLSLTAKTMTHAWSIDSWFPGEPVI
jgi:hypothetical protein